MQRVVVLLLALLVVVLLGPSTVSGAEGVGWGGGEGTEGKDWGGARRRTETEQPSTPSGLDTDPPPP